jgi:hypothetical protein
VNGPYLKLTSEEIRAEINRHGSLQKASKALNIPYSTLKDRLYGKTGGGRKTLADERQHGYSDGPQETKSAEDDLIYPSLPSSELDAEEIIAHACEEFSRSKTAADARKWFEIKVKTNKPIGIAFVGDPHVDNPGTNWPLLREHVGILRSTAGLYAIGGNDVADNWVGRLVRLYADQKMSRKQSLKVVKWLLRDAGIKYLCHILGNHDQWNDGPYLFKATAEQCVPVEDWQARFAVVFPNGRKVRIHMAHNFPGHSMWNVLHGAQKQALFGEEADIFACAHTHEWAMYETENPHRNHVYHLIRARGYKFIDQYASNRGYGSQRYGATVTAVIDPREEAPNYIHCFADLKQAAEFLDWKRSRA